MGRKGNVVKMLRHLRHVLQVYSNTFTVLKLEPVANISPGPLILQSRKPGLSSKAPQLMSGRTKTRSQAHSFPVLGSLPSQCSAL